MDGNGDDPFDSLTQLCVLSDSQEDILRRCSFAGNPKSVDGSGSFDSQILPPQPTALFMASFPGSLEQREQLTPNDAYQAPPEQSVRQQPMAVEDPSLGDAAAVAGGAVPVIEGRCVCDVATGVDLGKNPDLGFHLDVQSTQETAEIEIIGVRRREISESEGNIEVESASKRLKLSNEALGTTSSVPIAESGGESKLVDHNDEITEALETIAEEKVSNGEATHCKNKEKAEKEVSEKRVENSQPEEPSKFKEATNRDPWRRVLPSTINASKDNTEKNSKETETEETPSGNSGKPTSIVMEILKLLADEESNEEDEKLANMSILEIVTRRGMTFPRPCWWPEGWDFSFK